MRKNNIFLCLVFMVFFIFLCTDCSFAQQQVPAVIITSPKEGDTITPGQRVTIVVEAVNGFVPGDVNFHASKFHRKITAFPATFVWTVPMELSGETGIGVLGISANKDLVAYTIKLKIQQTAKLLSIETTSEKICVRVDWNGNFDSTISRDVPTVYGVYDDGVKREIGNDSNTTYLSNNIDVVSVDAKGNLVVHKSGEAAITISNFGVSKTLPLEFIPPSGIRPSETILPTATINIEPQPNSLGWYNQDLTITLDAQDNEGGSGVRDIIYRFPYLSAEPTFVNSDQTVVFFDKEGVNPFNYSAHDKEGNSTGHLQVELKLDKTPPQVTIDVPINESVYTLNQNILCQWSATDSLSGIESTNSPTPIGQAIDTSKPGTKSFTITSQDKASNSTTKAAKYYVRYNFLGILPPVKPDGSAIFKLGRTVPIKFQLKDANNSYVASAIAKIYLAKVSDNVVGQEIEAVSTSQATTGNLFRYDTAENQYIFILATSGLSIGTWQARIVLDDDTSQSVTFGVK